MLGITTNTKAAIACGVAPSYVAAATVILNSGDKALAANVLAGRESLLRAADKVRARAALITAFQNASDDDRIALGAAVGPGVVFDHVVVPAL